MTKREYLHQLVEELLESDLPTAERILAALCDTAPVQEWHIDDAPEDDEPETPEEAEAVRKAKARIAAGERLIPHEEAKRLLHDEP